MLWTHTLEKFTPMIPSYVKDTTRFLNIIKHIKLGNNDLLVTTDVSSLYTNIPHTEGIEAITRMMNEVGTDPLYRMFINSLAHQVLTKNYFSIKNQLYIPRTRYSLGHQKGTSYAIIFMNYLETNFLYTIPTKQKLCIRFTDGILLFGHMENKDNRFQQILNNHHPTIKFSHIYNKTEIAFLDTIVNRTPNNQLFIKIYHKPTDNKQYLHFNSAHPKKQKESVPYGLLIRCKRICSKQQQFELEASRILQQMKIRKYRKKLLEEAFTKVQCHKGRTTTEEHQQKRRT